MSNGIDLGNNSGIERFTHLVTPTKFPYSIVITFLSKWGRSHHCMGSVWAYIIGQDPSDSKSNWLHVDIFRCCCNSFEVYSSTDSSKRSVILLKPPTSTGGYFSNSTGSSVTNRRFSLSIEFHYIIVVCFVFLPCLIHLFTSPTLVHTKMIMETNKN
jgi:hypothetical protein